MRCILHIGAEKTGSTSIQDSLFANRQSLERDQGVYVAANPRNANLTWLAKAATLAAAGEINDKRLDYKLQLLNQELERVRQQADQCIVSTEHFHSQLPSKEAVAQLKTALDPFADSYLIVCYLRRQDELVVSRYSTSLRAGRPDRPLLPRIPHNATGHLFDFDQLLDRWAAVFGQENITPRIYDRANLVAGDVRADFYSLLGLTSPLAVPDRPSNTSLSAEAQLALATFNHLFSETPGQQSALHQEFVAYLDRHHCGTGLRPRRQEAIEFTRRFDESNVRCAKRWFNRAHLFNDDYSKYGDEATTADRAESARILGAFLLDAGNP